VVLLAREAEGPAYRLEDAPILSLVGCGRREQDHVAARSVEAGELVDVVSVAACRRPDQGRLAAECRPLGRRGV
jgi:hypothetical protein